MNFFWHRRDLRTTDNTGLYYALKTSTDIQPVFIFDSNILEKLEDVNDKRVDFIHRQLRQLKDIYAKAGADLWVFSGNPVDMWKQLVEKYKPDFVFANRDYEPYAHNRDNQISELLNEKGCSMRLFKDHVLLEPHEIQKHNGQPYLVFTPYGLRWKDGLNNNQLLHYPAENHFSSLHKPIVKQPLIQLNELGFNGTDISDVVPDLPEASLLLNYQQHRNFPAIKGTTGMSIHLRFGTLSIRQVAKLALQNSPALLNELAWRDFYHSIIWHFPHPEKAFKPAYDRIVWRNDHADFEKWCAGKTGYPMVDAGMRELNKSGFMHNRLRMITASFLTKHLLIDWRWGETYFAQKLNDFDLAANNGGWQWAAGCGCDAAPYFRIFNPSEQIKKYDPQNIYVRRWIPELNTTDYPLPMVEHRYARERALRTYKEALG